jgi:hypothetical protein
MKQPHEFLPETETTVPIIRGAGEGKAVGVLRDRSLFKVLPEETGGAYAVLEQTIRPVTVHRCTCIGMRRKSSTSSMASSR